jgi:hypothetical protein
MSESVIKRPRLDDRGLDDPDSDWGRRRDTVEDWYESARSWPGMAEKAERFFAAAKQNAAAV